MTSRISQLCAAGLLAALAPLAQAETIELWNGQKAEDATILRYENGHVVFTLPGKDAEVKAKLASVKSITVPESDGPVTLNGISKATARGGVTYTVALGITDERPRIYEPLVRVFVLESDDRGEREVEYYTNRRVQDPTLLGGVPKVNTDSYGNRAWELRVQNPLAWHIEVWKDGVLVWEYDQVKEGTTVADDWWRLQELRRGSTMKDVAPPRDAGTASTTAGDQGDMSDIPAVAVEISGAHIRQDIDGKERTLAINYVLRSYYLEQAESPAFTVFFLTETQSGERRVRKVTANKGGKFAKLTNKMYTDQLEVSIPDTITHGLGLGAKGDIDAVDNRKEKLLAWHLEATYEDTVVAEKTVGADDLLATLPKDWYK